MIRSTDNGMSWTEYKNTNGGKWVRERHMVPLGDGTVLDFGRAGTIIMAVCKDNGKAYTQAAETGHGVKGTGNNLYGTKMYNAR